MRDSLTNQFSTKCEVRVDEVLFKNLDDKYKNNDKLTINELKWDGYKDLHFKNTQVTFSDLQNEHRKEYIKTKKPRTIEKYDSSNNFHILPYFESFTISKIHQRDVEHWKKIIEQKK